MRRLAALLVVAGCSAPMDSGTPHARRISAPDATGPHPAASMPGPHPAPTADEIEAARPPSIVAVVPVSGSKLMPWLAATPEQAEQERLLMLCPACGEWSGGRWFARSHGHYRGCNIKTCGGRWIAKADGEESYLTVAAPQTEAGYHYVRFDSWTAVAASVEPQP